ncbi:MAG: glycosyltransferase family 39 protein [Elusimicrobia bacterium]|nr:glycosyltransferase family 39 protein [Candidatus Liberimonas magnetica]
MKTFYVILILSTLGIFNIANYISAAGVINESEMSWHEEYLINAHTFLTDFNDKGGLFHSVYAPLYYLNMALVMKLFGKSWLVSNFITNSFYLFILIFFTYLLGKELNGRAAGVISATIVSFYPNTWASYRSFSPDFTTMGIVVTGIYFLVKSGYYSDPKFSILFALACAWGMMLKESFGAFIIGPIFYGLFHAYRQAKESQYRPLMNFLAFSIIVYVLIYPYYFTGLYHLNVFTIGRSFKNTGMNFYDLIDLRFFTVGLYKSQLTPVYFLVMILGFYYFLRYKNNRIKFMMILWLLIPNLMLIFIPNKTERYLLAALPAFALISSFSADRLKSSMARNIFILFLIAAGLYQYHKLNSAEFKPENEKFGWYYPNNIITSYNELRYKGSLIDALRSNLLLEIDDFRKLKKDTVCKVSELKKGDGSDMSVNLRTILWCNSPKIDYDFSRDYTYITGDEAAPDEKTFHYLLDILDKSDIIVFNAGEDDIDLKNPGFLDSIIKDGSINKFSTLWANKLKNFTSRKIYHSKADYFCTYNVYLYKKIF